MDTRGLDAGDDAALRALSLGRMHDLEDRRWASWAETCVEDVVVHPARDATVVGRQAMMKWLTAFPLVMAMSAAIDDVGGAEDLAFVRGSAPATVAIAGVKEAVCLRWLQVFGRQGDGSWKMLTNLLAY